MNLSFRPLSPETFDAFAALHARPECQGCFCMYWHFTGDNRAWQAALATPEDNREAKRTLVAQGAAHGLLAFDGDTVVATVQFEPRDTLHKLTARMPYRDLPPVADTWALACFQVREDYRHRGVARALLAAAVEQLRTVHHARVIEAYPRRGEDLRDEEVWTGPEGLFLAAGFEVAREHMQYPVYRRVLGG
jgi:GNAT superfamily N-acetyltransferase